MDRSVSAPELTGTDFTWSTPATREPVIVHKRSRLAGLASAAHAEDAAGRDTPGRGPRVFTLRPSAQAEAHTEAAPPEPSVACAPARQRRARAAAQRPGEVTRIVFASSAEAAAAPTPAAVPSPRLPGEAGDFVQVNAQLDALLGQVKRSAYFAHLKFM